MVPRDTPHQGVVAEVERLEDILLADLLDRAADGRPLRLVECTPTSTGVLMLSYEPA